MRSTLGKRVGVSTPASSNLALSAHCGELDLKKQLKSPHKAGGRGLDSRSPLHQLSTSLMADLGVVAQRQSTVLELRKRKVTHRSKPSWWNGRHTCLSSKKLRVRIPSTVLSRHGVVVNSLGSQPRVRGSIPRVGTRVACAHRASSWYREETMSVGLSRRSQRT